MTLDGSTHLLNFKIVQTEVEMMSEADSAFLFVHLDHVQPKSRLRDDFRVSHFGCKVQNRTVQEPELTVTIAGKIFG